MTVKSVHDCSKVIPLERSPPHIQCKSRHAFPIEPHHAGNTLVEFLEIVSLHAGFPSIPAAAILPLPPYWMTRAIPACWASAPGAKPVSQPLRVAASRCRRHKRNLLFPWQPRCLQPAQTHPPLRRPAVVRAISDDADYNLAR